MVLVLTVPPLRFAQPLAGKNATPRQSSQTIRKGVYALAKGKQTPMQKTSKPLVRNGSQYKPFPFYSGSRTLLLKPNLPQTLTKPLADKAPQVRTSLQPSAPKAVKATKSLQALARKISPLASKTATAGKSSQPLARRKIFLDGATHHVGHAFGCVCCQISMLL